jgi:prepilin-type N-terminal cleavage/methylation domain-containing protein
MKLQLNTTGVARHSEENCPAELIQGSARGTKRLGAFTLAEMVVVMAVFSLLSLCLISSHMFGLRLYQISQTKLAATADGRKALNQVRDRIREGKIVQVGTGSATYFTNVVDNLPQIGNAIQIYPTTNLNVFTRIYLDSSDSNLKMVTGNGQQPEIVARFITNNLVFRAEDFRGTVLTNDDNNRVIRMTLEFYQWEYPVATIGQGGMYDYYRLQTRITRRLIE